MAIVRRTANATKDSWISQNVGTGVGKGNGRGERVVVGQYQEGGANHFSRALLGYSARALLSGVPANHPELIRQAKLWLKVRTTSVCGNLANGSTIRFFAERLTGDFAENTYSAACDTKASTIGHWDDQPSATTTRRGPFSGSPANGEWISVDITDMVKTDIYPAWYADKTGEIQIGLRLIAANAGLTGYEENQAARQLSLWTREGGHASYVEVEYDNVVVPDQPTELTPEDGATFASFGGGRFAITARYTQEQGKPADAFVIDWLDAAATDAVPGVPIRRHTVTAANGLSAHLGDFGWGADDILNYSFPLGHLNQQRITGKWRVRFRCEGKWGDWSLVRSGTPQYKPRPPGALRVQPYTLEPLISGKLASDDPDDELTAVQSQVFRDLTTARTLTMWDSGEVDVAGGTSFSEQYAGKPLEFVGVQGGTPRFSYRWLVRVANRDGNWSDFSADQYFAPLELISAAPDISPGNIDTLQPDTRPQFTITHPLGSNFDRVQVRYYSEGGVLLHDTGVVSIGSTTSYAGAAAMPPVGVWQAGTRPQINAAIRVTGESAIGPFRSENVVVAINAIPGAPSPVEIEQVDEVQRVATASGTPLTGTADVTFEGETFTIAWNSTAAQFKTAMQGTDFVDEGDISVSGGPLPDTPIDVTFGPRGEYAGSNVGVMTVNNANLVGGTFGVTTTERGSQTVQRADGVYVVTKARPKIRFTFRDLDKDAGYVEQPVRREVEVRVNAGGAHHTDSPYVATGSPVGEVFQPSSGGALAQDTLYKLRGRYDDAANARSAWSAYLKAIYRTPPSLSALSPAQNATITNPHPTFAWTYTPGSSGKAQADYRIVVEVGDKVLYDSGVVKGAATSHELPVQLLDTGQTVRWRLYVHDTEGLERRSHTRTFTTSFTQPGAVTGLTLTPQEGTASIAVAWTMPAIDAAEFHRTLVESRPAGGEWRTEAIITDVAKASYEFWRCPHKRQVSVRVRVDNGWKRSPSVIASDVLDVSGYWLKTSGERWLVTYVLDDDSERPTTLDVYSPLGNRAKVIITGDTYGLEGSWRGWTAETDWLRAAEEAKAAGDQVVLAGHDGEAPTAQMTRLPSGRLPASRYEFQIDYIETEAVVEEIA